MDKVKMLAEWIQDAQNIVFFGGAGTSTESGIPDFRSAAGLYQSEEKLPYSPEVMLSRSFFVKHPEVFFDFYRSKMLHPDAEPNGCHRFLASLEHHGRLKAVVTQNIDGLHQAAGSVNVLELHGSVHRNHCMKCGRFYSLNEVMSSSEIVPKCPVDGGIIKPDVVLYEEELNQDTLIRSVQAISQADLLLIGGTSLTVHPAAGLITYFRGKHTVLLNTDPTSYDHKADILITEPIGKVMGQLAEQLGL